MQKEKREEKEIFVDCGSYDGATSIDFINWCKKLDRGGISMLGNLIQVTKKNVRKYLKKTIWSIN